MNTEYAVRTTNLSKQYGTKAAVSHLNLKVRSGEIYGFIGRNGSCKSTTLKMCCGLHQMDLEQYFLELMEGGNVHA